MLQDVVWTEILPFVWLCRDREQDTTVLAVPSNKILGSGLSQIRSIEDPQCPYPTFRNAFLFFVLKCNFTYI